MSNAPLWEVIEVDLGGDLWELVEREVLPPPDLGIDLAKHYRDVRRLVGARFGYVMAREGFDIEDIIQDVCVGLLIRNRGTCAFDPRKSKMSSYINMVAVGVISNRRRSREIHHGLEELGVMGRDGTETDAGESIHHWAPGGQEAVEMQSVSRYALHRAWMQRENNSITKAEVIAHRLGVPTKPQGAKHGRVGVSRVVMRWEEEERRLMLAAA